MWQLFKRLDRTVVFTLAGIATLCAPAMWSGALAQTGDGTISAPYTREMALPGKMGNLTIINPGRIARPVCARKLAELMQSREGAGRLPDEVYDLYGEVSIAWNPNRLNYESVHYTFSTEGGVVVTMSCTLSSNKAVTFSVEGYARGNATLADVRPVIDGHFRYFGSQLEFHD